MPLSLLRAVMLSLAVSGLARLGGAFAPRQTRATRSAARLWDNLAGVRGKPRKVSIADVDGVYRNVHILDEAQTSSEPGQLPLVLLTGTAQTIGTWTGHIRELSSHRRLIIPELRSQGKGKTDLLPQHSAIDQHCRDVQSLLDALFIEKADFAGFSFGGRVALAFAAHYPDRVRKLSVTGVPLVRSGLGKVILSSWAESLSQQPPEMLSAAYSFVLNGYSPSFIERYAAKLPQIVQQIVESNDPERLGLLLHKSHVVDGPYSAPHCASLITCPTQVIGAELDRIASPDAVKALAREIKGSVYEELASCAHLAPFESPGVWRRAVLDFLR